MLRPEYENRVSSRKKAKTKTSRETDKELEMRLKGAARPDSQHSPSIMPAQRSALTPDQV